MNNSRLFNRNPKTREVSKYPSREIEILVDAYKQYGENKSKCYDEHDDVGALVEESKQNAIFEILHQLGIDPEM